MILPKMSEYVRTFKDKERYCDKVYTNFCSVNMWEGGVEC